MNSKERLIEVLRSFDERLSSIDESQCQMLEDLTQIRESLHGINNRLQALPEIYAKLERLSTVTDVDLSEIRKLQMSVAQLWDTVNGQRKL